MPSLRTATESVQNLSSGQSRRGKPLTARHVEGDGAGVGGWWMRTCEEGRARPLMLRRDYLLPISSWSNAAGGDESVRHCPAKQLSSRRGIAFRLHLVALYEMQLTNHPTRAWVAEPLPERSAWRDELARNRLAFPSWASLTLGYERPARGDKFRGWRRSRTEAVANGFRRLVQLELLDGETRTMLSEGRPWRRHSVDSRIYHSVARSEASFEVPSSLFSSGAYLRLSGIALHTFLVLACHESGVFTNSMIHRHALTRSAFERGRAELAEPGRLPDNLVAMVKASRLVRIPDL